MSDMIHSFDDQGYYLGSTPRPLDPVTKEPVLINEAVASLAPLVDYDPATERLRLVGGVWVAETIPVPEPEPEVELPLDELKARLQLSVKHLYEQAMSAVRDSYPPSERESWAEQLHEARNYLLDSSFPTPWINACLTNRAETVQELAQLIVNKAAQYASVSGLLTGARQRHEKEIIELTSVESAKGYDLTKYWPQ